MFAKLPMYQRKGASVYRPGLERMQRLDHYLGQPHLAFKSIHIGGTNGKGSTSHILSSVLQNSGYKVGLYTSPHLLDFRERIKLNGLLIPKEEVINFIEAHQRFFEKEQFSFFELTVAMAFTYFKKMKVDYALIEVGLGGRLDATNIITPILSIITNIGLDHTEFLGTTRPAIAKEKGGIIKKEVPVVIGEKDEATAKVFEQIANGLAA
ncbi:MAG: bifunctional folylpolyglutamate synthase/dihydrofolate synthase, partial [Flavobacteriia bacterium]|nr:bifunctional folylpolyglutamate synthase/dihydrofolate synthase [Flavobacteriia bacterium]